MAARRWLMIGGGGLVALASTALALLQWAPLYRFAEHTPRAMPKVMPDRAVVAHRGFSGVAPENTMAAFEAAAALAVPVELDVHLSASGVAVVIHNDTLDATTNGSGPVADATLETLRGLDAGGWFDPKFAGEPVPTLREALAMLGPRVVIDVELKTTPAKAELARAVVKDIKEAGLVDRVIVTSFDPYLLEQVRLAEPAIRRGQLIGSYSTSDLMWIEKRVLTNLLLNARARPDLVLAEHVIMTDDWLTELQALGYRVMVWTVDDPAVMKRWFDAGVDGVITNRPDLALSVRDG